MSMADVKDYLTELKYNIECDGEEKEPVSCNGLVRVLEEFLKALEK